MLIVVALYGAGMTTTIDRIAVDVYPPQYNPSAPRSIAIYTSTTEPRFTATYITAVIEDLQRMRDGLETPYAKTTQAQSRGFPEPGPQPRDLAGEADEAFDNL